MKPIRLIQMMILLLALFKAFSLIVDVHAQGVHAQGPVAAKHLLPTGAAHRASVPPPPPARGSLPLELAGTWYTGALPLTDFYDPTTGSWRAQDGLGQTYTFRTNGEYSYAAFLRLQTGLCASEVSVYREGKARVAAGKLTLAPILAKTHTVIHCGSNSESTTDGPFDAVTLTYDLSADGTGGSGAPVELTLTEEGTSTTFLRQEIAVHE